MHAELYSIPRIKVFEHLGKSRADDTYTIDVMAKSHDLMLWLNQLKGESLHQVVHRLFISSDRDDAVEHTRVLKTHDLSVHARLDHPQEIQEHLLIL